MPEIPEPDDSFADLSDEQQVRLLVQTDNGLSPEDGGIEQPSQDPSVIVESD